MLLQEQGIGKILNDDAAFNTLYSPRIQAKASRHWTPLDVAKCAAEFLVPVNDVHVLDIGSGVGKFCLAAAKHKPNGLFYGVSSRCAGNGCNLHAVDSWRRKIPRSHVPICVSAW